MPQISTGTTTIGFDSSLRIGFRAAGSAAAFTYVNPFPGYNQLPTTFEVPGAGSWQVEYTEICPNCSGGIYSEPVLVSVTI